MFTSKNALKKTEKSSQVPKVNKKTENNTTNDKIHSSHKVNLTWAQRTMLAAKGEYYRRKDT